MTTEYLALRDYIRDAIIEAWPGVSVILAQDSRERLAPFAFVGPPTVEIVHINRTYDEAAFAFVIAGRFALGSGEDAGAEAMEKAAALRLELLTAAGNPGGVGFLPLVSAVDIQPADTQDGVYDVLITFDVRTQIARA